MLKHLNWIFVLSAAIVAQDVRRKNQFEEPFLIDRGEEDVSCSAGMCVKRAAGQDEFGPFWANRGKKDPTYLRDNLFADEPHWILVRRDDKNDNEPFYVTRGKKGTSRLNFPNRKSYLDGEDLALFIEQGKKGRGRLQKTW